MVQVSTTLAQHTTFFSLASNPTPNTSTPTALIDPHARQSPYMVGIGNHEYDHRSGGLGRDPSGIDTDHGWKPDWFNGWTDGGGECGVPMYHRYHMPDNGNSVFWYSYDFGLVHMIMMSTEHDYSRESVQYKW